jgi:hypothetical protein
MRKAQRLAALEAARPKVAPLVWVRVEDPLGQATPSPAPKGWDTAPERIEIVHEIVTASAEGGFL